MIEAHVGLPGTGKSIFGVRRLIEEASRGRRTVANFHSATGMWEFMLWQDMLELDNAFIVIDEAQMWFSSRKWAAQEQSDLAVFQQSRKEGLDLLWIAQHENRCDVAIRELTSYIWRCRRVGPVHIAIRTTQEEPTKNLGSMWMLTPQMYWRHYYSHERIGDRYGNGYGFGRSEKYLDIALDPKDPPLLVRRVDENFNTIRYLPIDSVDAKAGFDTTLYPLLGDAASRQVRRELVRLLPTVPRVLDSRLDQ